MFCLLSCKNDKSIKVYSWEEYEKAKSKNPKTEIIVVDTICPSETKRAQKDIQKDSLVYYSQGYTPEVTNELKILLRPYHIYPQYRVTSCILPPKGFSDNCYGKAMNKEISKRFGENWIDSLEIEALKAYVIKNPDKPYIENGIDVRTKYLKK